MKKVLFLSIFLLFSTNVIAEEENKSKRKHIIINLSDNNQDKEFIEGTISFEMRESSEVEQGTGEAAIEEDDDEDYLERFEEMGVYSSVKDPYEGYNRAMTDFNNVIYESMLEPVAKGYAAVLPSDFRVAVGNLFDNVSMPVHFVSSLLQGDTDKSIVVLKRFVINTTLGLGGMGDVAAYNFDLPKVTEDMEQAFTGNDVDPGAYIVWPIIGPATAAGTVGKVFDALLNPITWIVPDFVTGAVIKSEEIVNTLSFDPEIREKIQRGSLDSYLATKNAYLQYREGLLKK